MQRYTPRHTVVAFMDLYTELWRAKVIDRVDGSVLYRSHLYENRDDAIRCGRCWLRRLITGDSNHETDR